MSDKYKRRNVLLKRTKEGGVSEQTVLFKNFSFIKDKEIMGCSRLREAKNTLQLNVILDSRLDPFLEEKILSRV